MTASVAMGLLALAMAAWPRPDRSSALTARRWDRPRVDRRRLGEIRLGRRERGALAVLTAFCVALISPPHAAGCAGVLVFVVVTSVERARAGRRRLRQDARDCDALQSLAAELRAGHDVATAFASVASGTASELTVGLSRAGYAIRMGEHPADALDRAASTVLGRQVAGLVRLSASHGVALAASVDVLAGEATDRLRQRRELAGLLAGPRATASLLAALPVFGVVMGETIGAHPLRTLLYTGAGALAMVVGVALAAVGVLWTQALVARAES